MLAYKGLWKAAVIEIDKSKVKKNTQFNHKKGLWNKADNPWGQLYLTVIILGPLLLFKSDI